MITDLTYLKSMSSDDENFIREMIDIFKAQITEFKVDMIDVLEKKDFDQLSKMAHKAKSSVAVMGMTADAENLKELELLAKEGQNSEAYEGMVKQFLDNSAAAIIELDEQYP